MKYSLMSLLLAALATAACTPVGVVAGAGATTGIAAAREGGISGAVDDLSIKAAIMDLWFKYDLETFAKLNLTIDQGRVLVTGVVQDPKNRVEAIRLAWQPKGVKQVINEIRVADSDGIPGYLRDTWITAQLRTQITFEKSVQSINYSIDTVQGIVYLMGVAHSQAELDRVVQISRSIKNVKQVISYVKLVGEVIPETPMPQEGAAPAAVAPTPGAVAPAVDPVSAGPLTPEPIDSAVLPP